jgi:hypothetical protein
LSSAILTSEQARQRRGSNRGELHLFKRLGRIDWQLPSTRAAGPNYFSASQHDAGVTSDQKVGSSNSFSKISQSKKRNELQLSCQDLFHIWGDSPCMGSLPVCGKSSCMWGDFAYMGRLPMHGKTSHICGGVAP